MSTDDGTGDTLYSSAIFGVSVNMYIPGCADEFSYAYGPRDCEAAFEIYAIGLLDAGPCAHEAGATTCLAACDALITDIMGDVCQDGDTMSMEGNEETKYPGNAAFALYAGTYYPQCKSALAPGRSTFDGVAAGAAAMAIASIFLA
ncbi:hypothetical protein ScalyP_jg8699 [Parmales sp. scaly parma]|nr:hypothetical protein ScalyP_jg8699 [Parmales sp. scaly parma]